jgi:hypothetical protein
MTTNNSDRDYKARSIIGNTVESGFPTIAEEEAKVSKLSILSPNSDGKDWR